LDLERELAGLAGTFLGDLDFATLALLLATARLMHTARGTVIEDPGLPRLAFLLSGNVRVFITSPDSRQLTVRYVRAGGLLGTRPRLAGREVAVRAQALTDTTYLELDRPTWAQLQKTNTSFNHALTGELTRRLEDIYRAFAMSAFGTLRERLAAHLLDSAEWAETGGLVAPMTHREMAEALGSAREVVTRGLRDLQQEGAIEAARGGTQIANLTRLAAIAGPWWTPNHFVVMDDVDAKASFDNSANAIVAIDGTGSIVYANASVERTFRWHPGDPIGQPLTALIPPGPAFGFGRHLASWLSEPREGPIGFGRTFHGLRADGSTFPAEITLLPARTATGPLVFASVADVSWRDALRSLVGGESGVTGQSPAMAVA
jgi:CRP/FNR family transcriptional regulator, cyclic AMP receptor protein